jgi:predicted TIM-barrel fold metal-dependent hydrolase
MPFLDPAPQLAKVVFARIPDAAKRRILGENAARLLGL